MTLKGCADPMEEVRGALFGLMAAHGAPEIIEQFGIVCEKLGCSTAPVIRAAMLRCASIHCCGPLGRWDALGSMGH